MSRVEIATPTGTAWADVDRPRRPAGLLLLGHGATGGVDTPDLRAVRDAAGMPPPDPARRLVVIPGADHSLRKDLPALAAAVTEFLADVVKPEHVGQGR